jgi:putative oxidoreductase
MTRNLEARLSRRSPLAVAVFRVVFGLLFACHGLSKLMGWPLAPAVSVGEWPLYYAGLIELVTGVLVVIGLFTRAAAFIACGQMAVAYFSKHLPLGLVPLTNHGESAALYCFGFLLLTFTGGAAYALDTRRARWRSTREVSARWPPNRWSDRR